MGRRGHGEGTVYQRCRECSLKFVKGKCPKCGDRKGLWVAVADLGRKADGKRNRKAVYGKTQDEAIAELQKVLGKARSGTDLDPEKLTVADYLARWLEHVKAARRLRTHTEYESKVRCHLVPVLGAHQLTKLRVTHIQALYDERLASGLSARTVIHVHEVLHNALQMAVEQELLAANPADRVRLPKPAAKAMRFLNFEQARRWLTAIRGNALESLHLAAIMTGMRQAELLGLRWQDVDLDAGWISVEQTVWLRWGQIHMDGPKGGIPGRVAIPPVVARTLKEHRARQATTITENRLWYVDRGLVWARRDGQPLRPEFAIDQLRKTLHQADLPEIRFHDLRHSAATLLLALGTPLNEVSKTLRHASVEITANLYGHVIPAEQVKSAQKLENALLKNTPR